MNKTIQEFAQICKINKFCITAYLPQSNGGIERMHHILNEYLKISLKKKRIGTSRKRNISIIEVVYGRSPSGNIICSKLFKTV